MLEYLSKPAVWRPYDPALFDLLQSVAACPDQRRLAAIEESGVIPGATYFDQLVSDGLAPRLAYMTASHDAFASADLVFYDPDNGLEVASRPKGRKDSSKHVFLEIATTYSAGRSVLAYQHFPRQERTSFVRALTTTLSNHAPGSTTWTFRTAHVLFVLLAQPRHARVIGERLASAAPRWDASFGQSERHEVERMAA